MTQVKIAKAPSYQKERRTYCTGFWSLAENKKYPADHYHRLLPATLDMIRGSSLVFHYDSEQEAAFVRKLCTDRNIGLTEVHLNLKDLPASDLANDLVEACQKMKLDRFEEPQYHESEKGMIHYWRDLKGSGESAYRDMLAIWLSKVPITTEVACSVAKSAQVAWIDASSSRFAGQRQNHNFGNLELPHQKLSHYGSSMRFFGARLPLNASFLSATAPVWQEIRREYLVSSEKAKAMPYGHDEETVLADCVWRRPDLFHCVGLPYQLVNKSKSKRLISMMLRAFSKSID